MKEFASDNLSLTWVFICPTDGRPVGGNKMIYRSAERLVDLGYKSEVFHPLRRTVRGRTFRIISILSGKPNPFLLPDSGLGLSWFSTRAKVSQRGLDPRKDLLIIPEVMVPDLAPSAIKFGFKYCIFAQNGFLIDSGMESISKDRLAYLYTRSQCVLSISESTSELIRLAYPNLDTRTVRVFVDGPKRFPHYDKSNIITYMPRKLALHSRKVLFFLESRLPPGWVIQPIDGLSESEAHSLLARSKIFLSFSELEGFGLPPYEAALLGNLVVGYSGSGGDEFFRRPVFRKVENGDLVSYVEEIMTAVSDWDNSDSVESLVLSPSSWLIDEYGDTKVNKLWQDAVAFVDKSISNGGRSL